MLDGDEGPVGAWALEAADARVSHHAPAMDTATSRRPSRSAVLRSRGRVAEGSAVRGERGASADDATRSVRAYGSTTPFDRGASAPSMASASSLALANRRAGSTFIARSIAAASSLGASARCEAIGVHVPFTIDVWSARGLDA